MEDRSMRHRAFKLSLLAPAGIREAGRGFVDERAPIRGLTRSNVLAVCSLPSHASWPPPGGAIGSLRPGGAYASHRCPAAGSVREATSTRSTRLRVKYTSAKQ